MISLITTAIQEGQEPFETVHSARENTALPLETVICDQGGNCLVGWDIVVWSETPGVHAGFETARKAASGGPGESGVDSKDAANWSSSAQS